jgi:pyruvate,water dikinase
MVTEGGKAAGLRRLQALGFDVPAFFVVPPDADPDGFRQAYDRLGRRVAVRSSALAEDGVRHSFAGQYLSVLGADGWDAVRDAIRTCRASGRSERVLAYCALHGLTPSPVAVVVQAMVEGDASGVLFTATPEDPERVLISAGLGLGEGVVQGLVPCDTFRVSADGAVEAERVAKDSAVRLVDGSPIEVPTADPHASTLSDAQARTLAEMGRRVAEDMGVDVDLEWTRAGDVLYLLQARPVTARIPRGRRLLWDNSNIIESYNGVTTPLTYSFANNAYTIVYQLFLRVMGVREDVIRANSSVFPRMIGLIRGRVYYNLNAWYRVVALLPGYRANKAFMEQMMGVGEVAAEEDAEAAAATWQERLGAVPEVVRLAARLLWRLWRVDADNDAFTRHFNVVYGRWRGVDVAALPPEGIVEAYEALERELLWAWSTPIVNDFFTMIFYGTLRGLCGKWVTDAGELHNELLAGEGALDSVAPMRDALALAALVRADASLMPIVRDGTDIEARTAIQAHPSAGPAWRAWMDAYGDRCVNELKLETPSLRQDPSFLVQTLRNYLRASADAGSPATDEGAAVRSRAEARAFAAVRGPRRWLFRWVLGQARARVRDRENLRFLRTRVFGLARDLFRALGVHMAAAGALEAPEDVFHLTVPEALGWVRGTAPSLAFRETVAVRRREFDGYRAAPPPADRFRTRGAVHAHNPFTGPSKAVPQGGVLRGTGCCPGVVEGDVAVLADPHGGAVLDGQILAAFRTDPGWVPLYPSVSGLLVERGSLLSHSAVVAREIGLPTIIGIPGLTRALRTGDRVRMDGAAGTVEKVERG